MFHLSYEQRNSLTLMAVIQQECNIITVLKAAIKLISRTQWVFLIWPKRAPLVVRERVEKIKKSNDKNKKNGRYLIEAPQLRTAQPESFLPEIARESGVNVFLSLFLIYNSAKSSQCSCILVQGKSLSPIWMTVFLWKTSFKPQITQQ